MGNKEILFYSIFVYLEFISIFMNLPFNLLNVFIFKCIYLEEFMVLHRFTGLGGGNV